MFSARDHKVWRVIKPTSIGDAWHRYAASISDSIEARLQLLYDLLTILYRNTAERLLSQDVDEQERQIIRRAYRLGYAEAERIAQELPPTISNTALCVSTYAVLLTNILAIDDAEPRRIFCILTESTSRLSSPKDSLSRSSYIFVWDDQKYTMWYFDKKTDNLRLVSDARSAEISLLLPRLSMPRECFETPFLLSTDDMRCIELFVSELHHSSLSARDILYIILASGYCACYAFIKANAIKIEPEPLDTVYTGTGLLAAIFLVTLLFPVAKRAIIGGYDTSPHGTSMPILGDENLASLKREHQHLLSLLAGYEEMSSLDKRHCLKI